jgi:hypothetical protein
MVVRLSLAMLLCLAGIGTTLAMPARIIILRHGEKADKWDLCDIGQERADALVANYLGRAAAKSLFAPNEAPAAFLAITLHSLELASPAAMSWHQPVTLYSVLPQKREDKEEALDRRTKEAANDLKVNPLWQGRTIVMVWEHKHIANKKLEKSSPRQAVTLRELLHLDQLSDVPETWPSGTYDYFWIIEYGNQGSDVPTRFSMLKQEFVGDYNEVPSNEWDEPNGLDPESGCDLKGAQD